jgi:predicted Zn-dependent peptidase
MSKTGKPSGGKGKVGRTEKLENRTLREEVHRTVLPSGLQVFFCPKRGFRKRFACYSVHYGSLDSEFAAPGEETPRRVADGIAHFLEHSLFETPRGNVSDLFARNGASSNAMTSFGTTTYLFSAADRFYENLALLLEFVEGGNFAPEKVEKEKGIIEQEIRMCRDDPGWISYTGLLESLFVRHPLRLDIAGSAESIARIDAGELDRCYRTFYAPSNMILFVVGDLDGSEVLKFVEKNSRFAGGAGGGASRPAGEIRRLYPEEPPEVAREEYREEIEIALPKLIVGFKEVGVPSAGKEFLERELRTELALDLLFGRSSDAFQELYVKELVLDDFGASYNAAAGVGYAAVGGETPRPEELRDAIAGEMRRVGDAGIPAEDFEREKRKFIGAFIRNFNSLEYIAGNYTYFRFHGVDLFEAVDALGAIRLEEVEERVRDLAVAQRAVSLVVPKA